MADNAFKTGQKLWNPFGNKKEEKTEESAYGRGKGKGKFKVRKSPKGRHTKGKKAQLLVEDQAFLLHKVNIILANLLVERRKNLNGGYFKDIRYKYRDFSC